MAEAKRVETEEAADRDSARAPGQAAPRAGATGARGGRGARRLGGHWLGGLWLGALLALGACKDKKPVPTPGADGAPPAVVNQPLLDEEVEPNDRPEQATPLASGKAVQGRILNPERGRDVDHYVIHSALPTGLLRVELTGVPGLDLSVTVVQKAQRKQLAVANNGRAGAAELLSNVGVGPGDYLIVVREVGKKPSGVTAPYTLMATLTAAAPGEELEPNDTRVDAQEVPVGTPISGYYGKRGDVDWYRLRLPDNVPESSLRVELTGVPSVPLASLSVQDEIEAVLKRGQTGRGTGVLFPNVLVKAGQRFLYLVTSGGKRFSPADRYTLTTTLTPRQADEEREPNDRPVQATPLQVGQRAKGYLAPAGDEDWYALEVPAPSLARLSVTGVDGVDLTLSVHDPQGAQRLLADDGRAREGELLPNAYLPAGRTLLRVGAKKGQENLFQTYELSAELRPAEAVDEREPNDTAATAGTLSLGGSARGYLYPRRDLDVFRLVVPGGPGTETAPAAPAPAAAGALPAPSPGPAAPPRTVRFEVRGIPKVPLLLVVKTSAGAVVAKAGPSAPEEPLRLEQGLAPGAYLVELSGGTEANPRDTYELRVTAP